MNEKLPIIIAIGSLILMNKRKLWSISDKAKKHLSNETEELINYFSSKYSIPAGVVAGIVLTESYDDPLASGQAGEIGIMQITEPAFNEVNNHYKLNYSFTQCYVKKLGLLAGMLYLKLIHTKYSLTWLNAIKAYNVGPDLKPASAANVYFNKVIRWL